ncbi:outer membrane lipoprotein carrier protein LolA [Thiomicrorhabdus sp.]|uniref:LolA family protein n=1 Tax=Thiomicrorhabdus sp. TaxID=2039724 RepID=UPI00356617F0
MKLNRSFNWLMGLIFTVSMPVYAQSELQDYVNQLKTFSADFDQIQPDEERFTTNASSGYFKLQRPGKLVWHYLKPEPQKIVADGINLWVQDDDLEQVTVRPINDIKSEIPLSWLLYDEPIEDRFTIIHEGSANGKQRYNLKPKEATYFQSIEIVLQGGQMTEVWMYQSADNVTRVRFKNIKMNLTVPADEFKFKLPKGYDLVGQPQ